MHFIKNVMFRLLLFLIVAALGWTAPNIAAAQNNSWMLQQQRQQMQLQQQRQQMQRQMQQQRLRQQQMMEQQRRQRELAAQQRALREQQRAQREQQQALRAQREQQRLQREQQQSQRSQQQALRTQRQQAGARSAREQQAQQRQQTVQRQATQSAQRQSALTAAQQQSIRTRLQQTQQTKRLEEVRRRAQQALERRTAEEARKKVEVNAVVSKRASEKATNNSRALTPVVVAKMKTSIGFVPSSGKRIVSDPARTTTILGRFNKDTEKIIKELRYPKTLDFGAKRGGFNLLNTPNSLYRSEKQFWAEYNRPFLRAAVLRGDRIVLPSRPTDRNLYKRNPKTGDKEPTMFGREVQYLRKRGYTYSEKTSEMIPRTQ